MPRVIAGTSVGALVGGLYAAGISLGRIVSAVAEACGFEGRNRDTMQVSHGDAPVPLGISGLIGGGFVEDAIDAVVKGIGIDDVDTGLAITSVDLESGAIVVFTNRRPAPDVSRCGVAAGLRVYVGGVKLSAAIRASISIPGLFVPRRMDKWLLVDGGVKEMVPAYEARRMGADRVVAVDLGKHVEKPMGSDDVVSILFRSFAIATRESAEKALRDHADLVLQPEVSGGGFPGPSRIRELYEAGVSCARENLGRLMDIIG